MKRYILLMALFSTFIFFETNAEPVFPDTIAQLQYRFSTAWFYNPKISSNEIYNCYIICFNS
ncbi:MAG: hypothetical protein Q8880_08985 [Bacteroidota bacterium]|nr:hypothetical protein [Bacteroidota bacterium]